MFKRLKTHKVISFVILLLVILFSIQILSKPEIDTNSYVNLIKGDATLNNEFLGINQKKVLKENDIIRTTSSGSLAIIEWGEGSITRIGANTSIVINKNNVSDDLTKIEIFFKILGDSGKTWSNVISFIGDDSYFKQGFVDTEAAVRGTIFEVNLDKNYLFVEKHEVELKNLKTKEEYKITENKAFDINKFDFILLQKFILKFRDKTWEEINRSLDSEFYKNIKIVVSKSIEQFKQLKDFNGIDIENLAEVEKEKVYKEILKSYQNLKPSCISPADGDIYKTKLEYQDILSKAATKENKKNIIRTSIYDLEEAIDLKSMDDFKGIIKLLGKNKEVVNFDDLNNLLKKSGLTDSFKKSLNGLIGDFDIKKINNIFDNGLKGIKDATNKSVNDLDSKLDKIKNVGNNIDTLTDNFLNN